MPLWQSDWLHHSCSTNCYLRTPLFTNFFLPRLLSFLLPFLLLFFLPFLLPNAKVIYTMARECGGGGCWTTNLESDTIRQRGESEKSTPGLSPQWSTTELGPPNNHQPPQSSICELSNKQAHPPCENIDFFALKISMIRSHISCLLFAICHTNKNI